jgi:hypothetical protein
MIYFILLISIIALGIILLKSKNERRSFCLAILISWMGGFCLNHVLTSLGVI